MEELSFGKLFSEEMHIKELGSITMEYRVNSFLKACNLDLNNKEYEKILKQYEHVFTRGLIYNFGTKDQFSIYAVKQQDDKFGDYIHINGKDKNMVFSFDNYYEERKIDKRILELPYRISIKKEFNGSIYEIKINGMYNGEFIFDICKDDNSISFYTNPIELYKILKIVNSFVNNPMVVYDAYSDVMYSKKIMFSNKDLYKGSINGIEFEKPENKLVKKMK